MAYADDYSMQASSTKNIDMARGKPIASGLGGGNMMLKSLRPTSCGSHALLHEDNPLRKKDQNRRRVLR